MLLGSMDSALPPKGRSALPLRKLSLGNERPLEKSPLIKKSNLCPELSESVVQLASLGKGATSNVFLAVHAATLKMIALKEVTVTNDADRRAVRTEMRALKTQRSPLLNSAFTTELASCPRIVDYYGSVVRENGNACIAVEYVAGGSLENWLELEDRGGSACPEPWFAHIAYQALEALDFVHTGGRIHRDVKPANLLITRNGDLKLGDFGAAGVENSSRMIGTQRFMAPERLKGHRATASSDLWSFGLSLATAALGDDFVSQGTTHFIQLDMAHQVKRTLSKETTLSPELRNFLTSCLSKNPAGRPALRELMTHPFLDRRQDWQSKCPEVALAMRDRKRLLQGREGGRRGAGGDPYAMSTEEVLDALCRVRAEEGLIDSGFDPATAADLAYELGVTPDFLVRNVHRRTLEFIKERGGGGGLSGISDSGGHSGVSDSGSENEEESGGASGRRSRGGGDDQRRDTAVSGVSDSGSENEEEGGRASGGGSRGGGDDQKHGTAVSGGGIASDAARRRRRRSAARAAHDAGDCRREDDECGGEQRPCSGRGHGDGSRSLSPPAPPAAGGLQVAMDVVPSPSVGGENDERSSIVYPLLTPRNRPTTGVPTEAAGFGGRNSSASSKRSRRRGMEMASQVKLTPHKRRGERKASQTKRNGSYCAADAKRSGRRRERERHMTAAAEAETPLPGPLEDRVAAAAAPATAAAGSAAETAKVQAAAVPSAPHGHNSRGGGGGGGGTSSTSTAAPTGSSVAGIVGGGVAPSGEGVCHTAECRRSWERRAKRNSKPRTAASRTLPSRNDVRMRSMRAMSQLADEMKAEIAVRDRVHRFRVYPKCFSGREAVQWMLDGSHASSVREAEKIGNEMMKASVFQHILNSHLFEDSSVYYQFTDGETPPPPSRGGRRLRQIARVVGGNVARRLVHGGGGGGRAGAPGVVVVGGRADGGSGGGPASGLASGAEAAEAVPAGAVGEREGDGCICSAAGNRGSSATSGVAGREQPPPPQQQQQQPQQPQQQVSKLAERSNVKRRSRGRAASSTSQLRRFSSSMSTLTVPETPY